MKTTTLAAAAVHPPQTNPTKAEQSCLIRSQVRGNVRCEVVNLLDKKIALELGATVLNGQTEVIKRAVKLKSDQCSGLLDIMQVNSSKPHQVLFTAGSPLVYLPADRAYISTFPRYSQRWECIKRFKLATIELLQILLLCRQWFVNHTNCRDSTFRLT